MSREIINQIFNEPIVYKSLSSFIFLIAIFILRWIIARSVRKSAIKTGEFKRKLFIQIRNIAYFIAFLGLIIIWASELRALVISLFAVLVAVVLATKEIIMCVSGGIVRAVSQAFSIGDRIEVNGIRGDVIDYTLLSTKIMEIGPNQLTNQYSGRAIVIPNSIFLSAMVTNETFTADYVVHSFTIPLESNQNWAKAEKEILEICHKICAEYLDAARKHFTKISKDEGLEVPAVDPRVTISLPESGKISLIVRVPTPARQKGKVEQAILREFLKNEA